MKVEVRCTDCKSAWLADEGTRADARCPMCQKPVGEVPAEAQNTAAAATGSTDRAVAAAPAVTAAAVAHDPAEVVCPRCKLYFVPRSETKETYRAPRKTVLVVEDMEYFRSIAEDALSEHYMVKTAESTAEARSALAQGGIDLMVLDLTLDGGEEGRRLLAELQPKPCPILIFTAQDESEMYGEQWDELARLGADDLVIKGMNVGESLVRKVDGLLGVPVDEERPID